MKNASRRDNGFSLLEVLFSMGMFSVAALALAQAFTVQLTFNTSNEMRSEAIMAAQQVLDEVRVEDPSSLPTSGSDAPTSVTIGKRTYVVVLSYCTNGSMCNSTTLRHLRAVVSYRGDEVYSVETVYAQLR
ncbi:MAG: type II secretion system protein [Deltaproteobacteria bacterium]|nr:type II secretion system protein [Deltaproteobacteria bacterium]